VDEQTLDGLPLAEGASIEDITVVMLLGPRSGLPDLFSEEGEDGAQSILELMLEDPDRAWSRAEMLAYTREHGAPVGLPGEAFHYADVNYDLLGLVLEGVEGAPWHEVVRAQVIDPLGLEQTWYYNLESAPDALEPIAGVWVGDVNLIDTSCLSADQAGGGLATTTADLVSFSRALEAGNPVERAVFEYYTEDAIQRGLDYGYGMWRVRPKRLTYGTANLPEMLGVSGVTGSFVYYVPAADAVVAGTFDQTDMSARAIRFLVADVLAELDALDR
jgi:D-alanyl-D-alanine carboxypeptidase